MTRPRVAEDGSDGLDAVRAAAAEVAEAQAGLDAAYAKRDQAIRDAVKAGAVKVHVAREAGIVRERLYQILEPDKNKSDRE